MQNRAYNRENTDKDFHSNPACSREKIEQIVRELVGEMIANTKTADNTQNISEGIDVGSLDENITMMLDNLEVF